MKDIPGYEGLYAVTEDGRVWSYPKIGKFSNHKGKLLKGVPDKKGYLLVNLYERKDEDREWKCKTHKVHRLVAITLIPNPKNLPQINHKNLVKSDNSIRNLEWVTNQENRAHMVLLGRAAKKLDARAVEIIKSLLKTGRSCAEISRTFSVNATTIERINRGLLWKHI